MSVLAIILARRGSKGLPGKNTAIVAGRPCIAWTIEEALAAETVESVLVSSDDPAALDIGSRMGAFCFVRPPEIADDLATIDEAARVSLRGDDAQTVVLLYGNVPVRPAGIIDRAVRLLEETGCDSVQSYEPVGKHHPLWTARVDEEGAVHPWEGKVLNGGVWRRQDLPPAYIPTGGVIVVRREALDLSLGVEPGPHAFLGRDRRGVIDEQGSTIDIDEPIDLVVAQAVLESRLSRAA